MMQQASSLRRAVLLTFCLLSACAASDVSDPAPSVAAASPADDHAGAAGAFLVGRFAAREGDLGYASDEFLKALKLDPGQADVEQQAFLTTLLDDRPEALRLAREQRNNPFAQLLIADHAASEGNWDEAESDFAAMPRQGAWQVLQPLLVAWAQQGQGRTDAALATLKPYVDGQRFRAVYALHAALIADMANHLAEAARSYRTAQTEFGASNLQLGRMLASWNARQGHLDEAQAAIRTLVDQSTDLQIAGPALRASVNQRIVRRPTDGIAEAYLALAAALHGQDANDVAIVLTRLALDMRPDFTPARLLAADITDGGNHPSSSLELLKPVAADDPLIGVVLLRRAALTERLGNTEDALRQLDQIAREYPDRPEPLALKADILREKRRFADAVTAYDEAVARVPHPTAANWPLFYDRGIALDRAHQWPRAEADLQHALELSPDQPYVMNYLGYSWTEQNRNLGRAKQMIERAVQARPNDGSIIDSLGWVELRQGDVPGAVKSLERAVELDSEDSTVNGHLGDAYWAAGRKLEAQFQWRRALNLNPEPDDVPKLEAKIRDGGFSITKSPATAEKAAQ